MTTSYKGTEFFKRKQYSALVFVGNEGKKVLQHFEQTIRKALSGYGEKVQKEVRYDVYKAAWNAHERAVLAQPALTAEQRQNKRKNFQDLLEKIENEFLNPSSKSDVNEALRPVIQTNAPSASQKAKREAATALKNSVHSSSALRSNFASKKRRQKVNTAARAKNFFAALVVLLILGVLAAAFLYKQIISEVVNFGRQSTASAPTMLTQNGISKNAKAQGGEKSKWLTALKLQEKSAQLYGQAQIQLRQDGNLSFLHISLPTASDKVELFLSDAVMRQFLGNSVLLQMIMRASGKQEARIKVVPSAIFSGTGQPHRYLFKLESFLNEKFLTLDCPKSFSSAPKIVITADKETVPMSLDLFAIAVKRVESP